MAWDFVADHHYTNHHRHRKIYQAMHSAGHHSPNKNSLRYGSQFIPMNFLKNYSIKVNLLQGRENVGIGKRWESLPWPPKGPQNNKKKCF
eukprot:2785559-Amphidinium_carterae.1